MALCVFALWVVEAWCVVDRCDAEAWCGAGLCTTPVVVLAEAPDVTSALAANARAKAARRERGEVITVGTPLRPGLQGYVLSSSMSVASSPN